MKDLGTPSMIEGGTENRADKTAYCWKSAL